jgi:hypothetical protein
MLLVKPQHEQKFILFYLAIKRFHRS